MVRGKLFFALASFGLALAPQAVAGKPPQVAEFDDACEATILAIRADWKARASLMKSQFDTIALQVKQGTVMPANALTTVVTRINEARAGILLDATGHCATLVEVGKSLVAEIDGPRPRDFQIGGGGVVDDFHAALEVELEKARKKVETHARGFRNAVFETTAGSYEIRFVLPKVPVPKIVAPGTTLDYVSIPWLHIPDTFLVLAGGRYLSAPNGGVLHVAGRVTSVDAPQPLPELVLFGANSTQVKMNLPLGEFGVFQTSFASLPSRDYELRLEQDSEPDSIAFDAGLQLFESMSMP